jgi:phosphatidylcholine synthase
VLALLATASGDFRAAALWMLLALVIDAMDGTMARAVGVSEAVPDIDGRRLDDMVDFLNYVIVPAVFLTATGAVSSWLWTVFPVLASAYGFAQTDVKTDDHFFVGFPSYWNVVAIYAWTLQVSPGVTGLFLVVFAIGVFVPIKYLYPSRTAPLWKTNNTGAALWTIVVAAAIALPERLADWPLIELSLLYPIYYGIASLALGGIHRRRG